MIGDGSVGTEGLDAFEAIDTDNGTVIRARLASQKSKRRSEVVGGCSLPRGTINGQQRSANGLARERHPKEYSSSSDIFEEEIFG